MVIDRICAGLKAARVIFAASHFRWLLSCPVFHGKDGMVHTPYCDFCPHLYIKPCAVHLAPAVGRDMPPRAYKVNKKMKFRRRSCIVR